MTTLNTLLKKNASIKINLKTFNFSDQDAIDRNLLLGNKDKQEEIALLKAYQRMLRLTDNEKTAEALCAKNLHSVFQITEMAKQVFIENHAKDCEPENGRTPQQEAALVYDKALARKMQLVQTYIGINQHNSAHYKTARFDNLSAATADNFNSVPSYEDFFGGLDFCTCPECRTIFSPAAYFVDLMQMQMKYIIPESPKTIENGILSLKTRRPDLWTTALSCKNTNTLIPTITIVNEVLTQSIGEKIENGEKLNEAVYPFNLPYNLPLTETNFYLKQQDTSLAQLWSHLSPEKTDDQAYNIQLATLGISDGQWKLYSTEVTDASKLANYYGTGSISFPTMLVDHFLKQTGLTYVQLRELLYQGLSEDQFKENSYAIPKTFFINANISPPIILNSAGEKLENLSVSRLDRLNRFIRLAQALNWSFSDLNWALMTAGTILGKTEAILDDSVLPFLAWVKATLSANPKMNMNEVCALQGYLKNTPTKDQKSFFDQVFFNDNVPYRNEFKLDAKWTVPKFDLVISSDDINIKIQSALVAALKLPVDDLIYVAEQMLSNQKIANRELTLNTSNLATLYRCSNLSKLCGLPFKEIAVALGLPGAPEEAIKIVTAFITSDKELKLVLQPVLEWLTNYGKLIKSGSFTTYGLQYLLTGQSSLASIQNQVLGDDALVNFHWDFQQSTSDCFITEEKLSKALNNYVESNQYSKKAQEYVFTNTFEVSTDKAKIEEAVKLIFPKEFATSKSNPYQNNIEKLIAAVDGFYKNENIKDKTQENFNIATKLSFEDAMVLLDLSKSIWTKITDVNNKVYCVYIPVDIEKGMVTRSMKGMAVDFRTAIEPLLFLSQLPNGNTGNYAVNITLLDKLTSTVEDAIAAFYEIQQNVFVTAVSELYNLTSEIFSPVIRNVPVFQESKDQFRPLTLQDLVATEENKNPGDQIKTALRNLQVYGTLVNLMNLSGAETRNLVEQPTCYGIQVQPGNSKNSPFFLTLENILTITKLKGLELILEDTQNHLLYYLENVPHDKQHEAAALLSKLLQQNEEQIEFLFTNLWGKNLTGMKPWDTIEGLYLITQWFAAAGVLDLDVSSLWQLYALSQSKKEDDTYLQYTQTAADLWGGLSIRFEKEEEKLKAVKTAVQIKTRNALAPYALYQLRDTEKIAGIHNYRDLSNYLLIDVEVGSEVETSRIGNAISTVQLYVHRCLNNLEKDVKILEELEEWWEWIANYRVWEANRKVFLFPENYIEPELRKDKTPLFTELETNLQSSDLKNPADVDAVLNTYMNGFAEVANLEVIGCAGYDYTVETNTVAVENEKGVTEEECTKTFCLVARTPQEPYQHYYRLVLFMKEQDSEQYIPVKWEPWYTINIGLQTPGPVKPIFAFGKWFINWMEYLQTGTKKVGDKELPTYTAECKLSFLDFNKQWTTPQSIGKIPLAVYLDEFDREIETITAQIENTEASIAYLDSLIAEIKAKNEKGSDSLAKSFQNYIDNTLKVILVNQKKELEKTQTKIGVRTEELKEWDCYPSFMNSIGLLIVTYGKKLNNEGKVIDPVVPYVFEYGKSGATKDLKLAARFAGSTQLYTDCLFNAPITIDENIQYQYWKQSPMEYTGEIGNSINFQSCLFFDGKKTEIISIQLPNATLKIDTASDGELTITNERSSSSSSIKSDLQLKKGQWNTFSALLVPKTNDVSYKLPTKNSSNNIGTYRGDPYLTTYSGNKLSIYEVNENGLGNEVISSYDIGEIAGLVYLAEMNEKLYTYWLVENKNKRNCYNCAIAHVNLQDKNIDKANFITKKTKNGDEDLSILSEYPNHDRLTNPIPPGIAEDQICWLESFRQVFIGTIDPETGIVSSYSKMEMADGFDPSNNSPSITKKNNNLYVAWLDQYLYYVMYGKYDTSEKKIIEIKNCGYSYNYWGIPTNYTISTFSNRLFFSICYDYAIAYFCEIPTDNKKAIEYSRYPINAISALPVLINTEIVLTAVDYNHLTFLNPPCLSLRINDSISQIRFMDNNFYEKVSDVKPEVKIPNTMLQQEVLLYIGNDTYKITETYINKTKPYITRDYQNVVFNSDGNPIDSNTYFAPPLTHKSIAIGEPGWQVYNSQGIQLLSGLQQGKDKNTILSCYRLNTTAVDALSQTLYMQGIPGLLSIASQLTPEIPFSVLNPQQENIPESTWPTNTIDFGNSAMSEYYWEIFFYMPFLIAKSLQNQEHADAANNWYEYIFNPIVNKANWELQTGEEKSNENDKYWRFVGLRAFYNKTLHEELNESWAEEVRKDTSNAAQIYAYHNDPFDPHAIAMLRPIAYQKTIVMHYIDNLIKWGDKLFRQYTVESITEASMIYMMAYDLLGNEPMDFGACPLPKDENYTELLVNPNGNEFLIYLEQNLAKQNGITKLTTAPINYIPNLYFGLPENELFLTYWDTVKERLYFIRHGLNIDGVRQKLALFQPAIDPAKLVEQIASGASISAALTNLQATIPYYRFAVMIQLAKNTTQTVMQFGQSLLAALEKKDAEQLSLMYNQNQLTLLQQTTASKQAQVDSISETLDSLKFSLESAEQRYTYYEELIDKGLLEKEEKQLDLLTGTIAETGIGITTKTIAIGAYLAPTVFGLANGAFNPGASFSETGAVADAAGNILSTQSSIIGTKGSFERRKQEWEFQKKTAEKDKQQLEHQILSTKYQKEAAIEEVKLLKKNIDQEQKVQQFLKNKFTNKQLYQWMAGKLAAQYFQVYQLAYDMSLQAQQAWNFEKGTDQSFIKGGYWDGLYQGLLAGEALLTNLMQMENAFMLQNKRRLEIQKTISLKNIDEIALKNLKEKGECLFNFDEILFNKDYPGQYCRQIVSLSISFPTLIGPYQNIHATLTQLTNTTILKPSKDLVEKVNKGEDDKNIRRNVQVNQQIALSQGINDSGMFTLNFNDERYLPFEGTGAVSSWKLAMKKEENTAVDFDNLTDVIIQLNYTALQGSSAFEKEVSGATKTHEVYHNT